MSPNVPRWCFSLILWCVASGGACGRSSRDGCLASFPFVLCVRIIGIVGGRNVLQM